MKNYSHLLPIIISLIILNLFLTPDISGQGKALEKESNRSYYKTDHQSFSSIEHASTNLLNKDKVKGNNAKITRATVYKLSKNYTSETKNYSDLRNKPSENYFHIDLSGNTLWDGKHWEKSMFPLRIYVEESTSKYYKSSYKEYIKYAMDVWRKADDRIQYNFVISSDEADIEVIFVENLADKYEDSYLGLTDYEAYDNKELNFSKIQISLIKNGNEKVSAGEIKATIIHELGHAFGLGHSKNRNDLMFPYISSRHKPDMNYDELSNGDKMAIRDVLNLSFDENYAWK